MRHDGTGAVAKFACDAWLANENGVVAETTLIAAAGSATSTTKFNYRVDVTTGSRMGAGTDSKVSIGIHCEGMEEAWTPALEQRDEHFASGATDTFVFSRRDELPGNITAVTLTCADAGVFGDSWFCEKAVVSSLAKGTEWVFHCGDWVGKQGTRLEQGILASVSVEDEAKAAGAAAKAAGDAGAGADAAAAAAAAVDAPTEYRVTFWTGGEFGAGTDATVSAELFGSRGSSGALTMDRDASMFDAKCVDAFTRVSPTHLGEPPRRWCGSRARVPPGSCPRCPATAGTSTRSRWSTSPRNGPGRLPWTSGSTPGKARRSGRSSSSRNKGSGSRSWPRRRRTPPATPRD